MGISPELGKALHIEAKKIQAEYEEIDNSSLEGQSRRQTLMERYREIESILSDKQQSSSLEKDSSSQAISTGTNQSSDVGHPQNSVVQADQLEQGHMQGAPVVNMAMPKRSSSLGIASIIIGFLALFISIIPLIGVFGFLVAMVALLLGTVGLVVALTRKGTGIGYPLAGIIVAGVAFLISIFQIYVINSVGDALEEVAEEYTDTLGEVSTNDDQLWIMRHYVDDFGEPTESGYITNGALIRGTFSNSATEDSALNVLFLISDSSDVSIQLYEYGRDVPVKSSSTETFEVNIQDRDGNRTTMRANLYSDRITFGEKESSKVHEILTKGDEVKFRIVEINRRITQYAFDIRNTDSYKNVYQKLIDIQEEKIDVP